MSITKDIPVTSRSAWKPYEDNRGRGIISCDWDDDEAAEFRIGYTGSYSNSTTLDFKTQYLAEAVERALHRVFKEGRKQTKRDLKAWLGSD